MDIKKLKLFNKWSITYLIMHILIVASIVGLPISLKYVVKSIQENTSIVLPIIAFAVFGFFLGLFNILYIFIEKRVNIAFEQEVKAKMLEHFSKKDFASFKITEFENHLLFDSNKIISDYMFSKLKIISGAITTSIVIATIAYISLIMLPIVIIVNLLVIFINKFLQVKSSKLILKHSDNRKEYLKQISDFLLGYDDSSSLNALHKLTPKYLDAHNDYAIQTKKLINMETIVASIRKLFSTIVSLTIWISLVLLTNNGNIEVSSLIVFIGLDYTFSTVIKELISSIYSLKSIKGLSEKIFKPIPHQNTKHINNPFPITTNKLYFVDNKKELHFNNVCINDKDKILLKGGNGSGKSVLLKMVLNLLPYHGEVFFNKAKINTQSIATFSGYLPTNPMIFDGTIAENILLKKQSAIKQEILSKYEILFNELPSPLENALNLSHGQKQIVSLIRGLISRPKLIIIDEGLSGVAKKLVRSIEKMLSALECAVIYVSHQTETNFEANKVIKKGNRV